MTFEDHEQSVEVELKDFGSQKFPEEELNNFENDEEGRKTLKQTMEEEKETNKEGEEEEEVKPFPLAPITMIEKEQNGEEYFVPPWDWKYFLIYILIHIVGVILLGILFIIIYGLEPPTEFSLLAVFLVLCVQWTWMAGYPLILSFTQGNGPIIDFGITFRASDFKWGFVFGSIAFTVAIGFALITQFFFGEFDSSVGSIETTGTLATVFLYILVAVPGPIVEELLFRGLFFYILAYHRLHKALVVIIIGFFFMLVHMELIRILILFFMGCLLTYARVYTQSITPCIIAHVVNNSLAVLVPLFWMLVFGKSDDSSIDSKTMKLMTGY